MDFHLTAETIVAAVSLLGSAAALLVASGRRSSQGDAATTAIAEVRSSLAAHVVQGHEGTNTKVEMLEKSIDRIEKKLDAVLVAVGGHE